MATHYEEPPYQSPTPEDNPAPAQKPNTVLKGIAQVIDGSFLSRQNVVRQLPFVLFITFLAVLYIANAYYAERNIRQANKVGKEIEQLRGEYLTTQAKVSEKTRISNISTEAEKLGLKPSVNPPAKLSVKQTTTTPRN